MRLTKTTILILLSLLALSCAAHSPAIQSITAGDVAAYLAEAPKAQDHPNAGAIVLAHSARLEFFEDGTGVFRQVERIKIFNERGRSFATQAIAYREGFSSVNLLFANTIRPDGSVIALNPKDIHDATAHAGYDFYTDIKEKRFTMPAVEDGCILEYAFEMKMLKSYLPFDVSGRFHWIHFHPAQQQSLEIILPEKIRLQYKPFHTSLSPEITSEGGRRKYVFRQSPQKEVLGEARMPDIRDRKTFPEVAFWTMPGWENLSKWYIGVVREQMKPDDDLTRFTRELTAGLQTDEDKIQAIFDFVAQKVRYVAVMLGPHTHMPHAASDIFKKRYGDCKDKTTLLLSMLQIAGISGLPALVPSNPEYFDETIPSLSVFDHVIAVVPRGAGYFWLDATNENAAYDSPPFMRPSTVMVIQADGSYRFVQTPAPDPQRDFTKVETTYHIDEAGDAHIDLTMSGFGMAAQGIRDEFKYLSPVDREKYFEERRGIEVQKLSFGSFTDTTQPFVLKLQGLMRNVVQKLDDDLMVLTGAIPFDSFRDITAAKNPRTYPIVFYPSYRHQALTRYRFPKGFKVRKMPPSFVLDKPFKFSSVRFDAEGSTLILNLAVQEKDHQIPPDDFEAFKQHAAAVQKLESALKNIIFEKK